MMNMLDEEMIIMKSSISVSTSYNNLFLVVSYLIERFFMTILFNFIL